MATNGKNKRNRRVETDYEVIVPDGMPSDIDEIISKAHAKAESLNRARRDLTTNEYQTPTEVAESAE